MAKTLTPLETESQFTPQLGTKLSENNPNEYTSVVTIKEENEDELGLGVFEEELGIFGIIGSVSGSVSASKTTEPQQEEEEGLGVARAFEMLHGLGPPPPFLTKTYEMVENPETDEIVSWGSSSSSSSSGGGGTSFVVWDPHKFSTDLLPKFFKHSNFSSFVRQLNTYGFKKVHLGRWEFANAAFQRGKKHLLRSIKRKYHNDKSNLRLKFQTEAEIEKLKLEQEALKVEIRDLKQQQLNSNQYLATLEERMKSAEWKQRQFLLFIAKAMKKAPLFQQLLQNYQEKKALDNGQVCKRRRLASDESPDDSAFTDLSQTPGCTHEDGMAEMQLEANALFGSSRVNSSPHSMQEQSSSYTSETCSPDLSTGSYIMWEKLLEDDVVCEGDEEEAFANDQSKFVHELEDLIAKPPAWGSFANAGEVACPGGQ